MIVKMINKTAAGGEVQAVSAGITSGTVEKHNRRILFISDYLRGGGAEIVLNQLIDGLKSDSNGWEVSLFYGAGDNNRKKGNPFSYIYSFKYRRKLSARLKLFQPGNIHFVNYYHILTPSVLDAVILYKRSNPEVKVFYTAHDYHLVCPNSGLTSFRWRTNHIHREPPRRYPGGWAGRALWFRKWDHRGWVFSTLKLLQWIFAYRWSNKDRVFDKIIAPGKFMYTTLSSVYREEKVQIIRNPYPGPEIPSIKALRRAKSPLKLVFIGRLAQEKGLKSFFESVPEYVWEKIEVHIYGSGPDEEDLKKIITGTIVKLRCYFHGRQPHEKILSQLPLYDALLLPSIWYENTPLTIVEAAFAGIRVLCSDWGGAKELANYCGGAYLFNPEDKESTEKAIEKLYRDVVSGMDFHRDMEQLRKSFSYFTFINSHISLYTGVPYVQGEKVRALFLDRDGILIEDTRYPHRPEDFHLKKEILPLLERAMKRGYRLFIMTNQSGIGRGIFTEDEYRAFMDILETEFRSLGITFTKTYFCPCYKGAVLHEYDLESEDRKPRPGMFLRAAEDYNIDLSHSIMIGDKDSDRIELPELRCIILRGKYPLSEKPEVCDSVGSVIKILGWNNE